MNTITAEILETEFVDKPHISIVIDDEPLDMLIAGEDEFGEVHSVGLVPTLLDWLNDEKERAFVWERILPEQGKRAIAPVLMCPDDCDLVCTVVVAEIENKVTEIVWKRIGIDVGRTGDDLQTIGKKVEWFDLPAYRFATEEYKRALAQFK
jgi:hypothetical protein